MLLLLVACSGSDRHLVVVKNDKPVDLSRLEEVRKHLNGFWVPEDARDEFWKENILWWSFHKDSNYALEYFLPYNDEIKRTETVPIHTDPIHIEPMRRNGQTYLARVGLGGSDTVQLELLTRTKCVIGGYTYRRHKGYAFLQPK
ncbi:MAG TPA: hypothetical protein PLZ12_19255 [Saprospiraceae bacterium]|nr:hypothetical protein [Saprospiraceae bacterium]